MPLGSQSQERKCSRHLDGCPPQPGRLTPRPQCSLGRGVPRGVQVDRLRIPWGELLSHCFPARRPPWAVPGPAGGSSVNACRLLSVHFLFPSLCGLGFRVLASLVRTRSSCLGAGLPGAVSDAQPPSRCSGCGADLAVVTAGFVLQPCPCHPPPALRVPPGDCGGLGLPQLVGTVRS